ncbi:hypothetical protein LN042_28730 [Kitasatospora sp. RB6PN24]|uniref:hypothetical protein n=1 Tax=Kitasatospora humi TaxID=2893891 RepID=UPI001E52731D|nr:hypothetical protein [Kitasatospora humi]MCC9311007.1 hypothetical protein [Kitasatospora humi]
MPLPTNGSQASGRTAHRTRTRRAVQQPATSTARNPLTAAVVRAGELVVFAVIVALPCMVLAGAALFGLALLIGH